MAGPHIKIQFAPFLFPMHTLPMGVLPNEIGCHACWYYARIANQHLIMVADGAVYEGERDHQEMLVNLCWSVAQMYRLDNPGEFLKYMSAVKLEAERVGHRWDDRIEYPMERGNFVMVTN